MITVQNPEFLLLVPLVFLSARFLINSSNYGRKLGLTRTLLILLLVFSAASPAYTQTQETLQKQQLDILVDNTTSTQVLKTGQIPDKGSRKVFIQDNNSQIFSQAAAALEEGSHNLLVTDGRTRQNTGELIEAANNENATVSVYIPETREEQAVRIEGPSQTVPGALNRYTVKLSKTSGKPVELNLTLDGKNIYTGTVNNSYSFEKRFNTTGSHTLQAHIRSEDIFSGNNHFYRTVDVRQKPEILSVGAEPPAQLEKFYKVDTRNKIPEELDKYYAVFLGKKVDSRHLKNYVVEGNGLLYTGSMKDSVPDYLPVRPSEKEKRESGARVILLIDISHGSGKCVEKYGNICVETSSEGGKAKESIKIAYSLVDAMKKNNRVGVIAYNREAHRVSKPLSLASHRETIKDRISRLQTEGPSFHDRGLEGAASLAEENDTVVMLTDGEIGTYEKNRGVPSKLRSITSNMESKLITVGVGQQPNQPLLEDIAQKTGGYYLENREAGRLKFNFGAGGGEAEYTPLKTVNPAHFITRGLKLDGSTTDFKPVEPKRSADQLVSGANGLEYLTTWRYGLGRVAAFSAGEKDLSRVTRTDPELVSKTVAWAVGNPRRKEDNWTDIEDSSRPEKPVVKSTEPHPELTKKSQNLYTRKLEKPGTGLKKWHNETYAYNYNPEIRKVGPDTEKLQKIAQDTGGRIYDSEDIENIGEDLEMEKKDIRKRTSLTPYLLVAALLVFLAEVGYRKRKGRM
ncbi:MAG: VWA domain-containing protein [Candidatus Nanohalobium sp.]